MSFGGSGLSTDGAVDATENDDDFVHTLAATSWLSMT
jgi:hypothetical protein